MTRQTFKSTDGSTRCARCHLFPDQCTCDPDNPMWAIFRACGLPAPKDARS